MLQGQMLNAADFAGAYVPHRTGDRGGNDMLEIGTRAADNPAQMLGEL